MITGLSPDRLLTYLLTGVTVQDLTVTITSERPETEVDIIPDEEDMSGINIQTFVDQQVALHHPSTNQIHRAARCYHDATHHHHRRRPLPFPAVA